MPVADRDELVAELDAALRESGDARALVVVRLRKLAAIAQVHGEEAAAQVLADVRARLDAFAQARHFIADLGEGTFALVMEGAEEQAEALAERIIAAVSRPVTHAGAALYAPANAGICPLDASLGDASAHLDRALRALQRAMSRGPGAAEVVSEAHTERAVADWHMRTLLEEAGIRGELSLEYQPIHAPDGGDVRKVEALVRWDSPVLGRVSPENFIPILEESGLIRPVGEWILRQACASVRTWRSVTGLPIRVAVNLSPVQLTSASFEKTAARVLQESGCEAAWIELEVTEGVLVRDFARLRNRLEALAAMGFTLAIDDFGAGYSSLGQLAQMPVHNLKIDRSLVSGLPDSGKRGGIVAAVVGLADALGLGVTCEGVERADQAQWLARFAGIRCQGYFFSRPMAQKAVPGFLRGA